MKHKLLARLLAFLALALSTQFLIAQTPLQPQGSGTEADPYLISNWQELYWVSQTETAWDKHFLQTENIDFADAEPAIETWDEGRGWTPIGYNSQFTGDFNGNGKIINRLYINRSDRSAYKLGFFSIIEANGNVHSIGLTNIQIIGLGNIGGFTYSNYGTISNSFVTGEIEGDSQIGGFAEFISKRGEDSCSITNCFSRVDITNHEFSDNSGGFVAYCNGGFLTNCYSTGRIDYINGQSPTDKGFVSHVYESNYPILENNYWDTTTSGQTSTGGDFAIGLDSSEMKISTNFENWDFTNVWICNSRINEGYPFQKVFEGNTNELSKSKISLNWAGQNTSSITLKLYIQWTGGSPIFSHGFILDTVPSVNPNSAEVFRKVELGIPSNSDSVTYIFNNLPANTKYYATAYATNSSGTYTSRPSIVYTIQESATTPQGTGDSLTPYLISNLRELYWIAKQVNDTNNNFSNSFFYKQMT